MKIMIFFIKLYIILLKIIQIKLDESNEVKQSPNIAVIPFKLFYPPINNKNNNDLFTSEQFMDNIHSSLIYLEIEIGKNIKSDLIPKEDESKILNNKQFISLFIVLNEYNFYIDDNHFFDEKKKLICRYSSQLSTSYEVIPSKNNDINKNKNILYASDYFKIFSDLSLNEYNQIKLSFKHNFDKNVNISFACGKSGLFVPSNKLYIETGINFIYQIHTNLENVDYSFKFHFNLDNENNNDNDGVLIIGAESYEKNNKEELISVYNKPNSYGSIADWRFDVDQITIGNEYYAFTDEDFILKIDIECLEIPYVFYEQLKKVYFNYYFKNEICKYDIVNNNYIILSCNENSFNEKDINNFPEINFLKYKLEYNFTFTGKELFYKKNNNYYFKMIINLQRFQTSFKFGRIFLKKYPIIFNPDNKMLFFYKGNKKINNEKNEFNKKDSPKKIFWIGFSYIFIGIIFLILGIYFGRKYCIMRRKKYANELNDNYVYEPQKKKDMNKEYKLIEI